MKKVDIKEVQNGYLVMVEGSIRFDGPRVFKSTELYAMMAFIGEVVIDKKVSVEDR